ncbi:hypothetical protein OH492_21820 [Vibrio chagasii]|nr:hypothetical protein [Vibrio chagasii]
MNGVIGMTQLLISDTDSTIRRTRCQQESGEHLMVVINEIFGIFQI